MFYSVSLILIVLVEVSPQLWLTHVLKIPGCLLNFVGVLEEIHFRYQSYDFFKMHKLFDNKFPKLKKNESMETNCSCERLYEANKRL